MDCARRGWLVSRRKAAPRARFREEAGSSLGIADGIEARYSPQESIRARHRLVAGVGRHDKRDRKGQERRSRSGVKTSASAALLCQSLPIRCADMVLHLAYDHAKLLSPIYVLRLTATNRIPLEQSRKPLTVTISILAYTWNTPKWTGPRIHRRDLGALAEPLRHTPAGRLRAWSGVAVAIKSSRSRRSLPLSL